MKEIINCTTCEWERKGMICLQGHVRRIKYEGLKAIGHIPIESCHAWKAQKGCERCYCWIGPRQAGIYKWFYCPHCGRVL